MRNAVLRAEITRVPTALYPQPGESTAAAGVRPAGVRRVLGGAVLLAATVLALWPAVGHAQSVACNPVASATDLCRIDQPDVTHAVSDVAGVRFAPGDSVHLWADGCAQTGGSGSTWKRYVNPQGPNSDRLYHGLVGLISASAGVADPLPLTRFSNVNDSTRTVTNAAFLRVG